MQRRQWGGDNREPAAADATGGRMLSVLLDVGLLVLLLAYLVNGYRSGLLRSIFGVAGLVAAVIGAVLLIPLVTGLMADARVRIVATLILVVALLIIGSTIAGALGRRLARALPKGPLRIVDRLLGAVAGVVVTALAASMLAFGVGTLGVPLLSPAIASSVVLTTIDRLTPDPVKSALAQLRGFVVDDGIPRISEALSGPVTAPDEPSVDTATDVLSSAARSVVRISGNAYACGQSQTGSGFVVAPDRIVTNAHVVSGVTDPIVETRDDGAVQGRVVYFDPVGDLAVIATEGLATPPLTAGSTLTEGSEAVVDGYPFGGPFTAKPATVLSVGEITVDDIYGSSSAPREVYSLAADVQQGNSGGPLLATDGSIAGVVFAKGAETDGIGYAVTMTELSPVLDQAAGLRAGVPSGTCTTH